MDAPEPDVPCLERNMSCIENVTSHNSEPTPSYATYMWVIIMSYLISLILPYIYRMIYAMYPIRELFNSEKFNQFYKLTGTAIAITTLVNAIVIYMLRPEEQASLSKFSNFSRNEMLKGYISSAICTPIIEEAIFRYFILLKFLPFIDFLTFIPRGKYTTYCNIITAGVIFGIAHLKRTGNLKYNSAMMIAATSGGIVYGVVTSMTGNIMASTFCHMITNSVAIFAVYYNF